MQNTLLKRIVDLNEQARKVNKRQQEERGFAKATIDQIANLVKSLQEKGYEVLFEINSDGVSLTQESVDSIKNLCQTIYKDSAEKADRLEKLLTAVESKDYDTIQKLTGEDLRVIDYNLEFESVEQLKADVAKATEGISIDNGLSSSVAETLDLGGGSDVTPESDDEDLEVPVDEDVDVDNDLEDLNDPGLDLDGVGEDDEVDLDKTVGETGNDQEDEGADQLDTDTSALDELEDLLGDLDL